MTEEKELLREKLQDDMDKNQTVELSLYEFLSMSNGVDEDNDPLSVGSVHIARLKDGHTEQIKEYELPGAVYQILVRDHFIQLNVEFERNARPAFSALKRAMEKYDEVTSTKEDLEEAVYGLHMVVFPLSLYGAVSMVLANPILWVPVQTKGFYAKEKECHRIVLLFEKDNCQFVSNEDIDIVGIRAEVEREIKQEYDLEEEAYLQMEEEQKRLQKEAEQKAANDMIVELSGLNDMDFDEKIENQYQGRVRFTSDKRDEEY